VVVVMQAPHGWLLRPEYSENIDHNKQMNHHMTHE
jgi:hypothetical protein